QHLVEMVFDLNVIIPLAAIGIGVQRDERYARLHKSPAQEGALAPDVHTVSLAQAGLFALQIEGLAGGVVAKDFQGLLPILVELLRILPRIEGVIQSVQLTVKLRTVVNPRQIQPRRQMEVGCGELDLRDEMFQLVDRVTDLGEGPGALHSKWV